MTQLDVWKIAADILDPPADTYRGDPAAWASEILNIHLWSKQREIAESVRDNQRTAVRSGHGVGKTLTAAVVGLWFLDVYPNSRVITTATKWSQVEKQLWHEIGQLHKRALSRREAQGRPITRVKPLKTQLNLPDGRYAIGLSSKPENSESFAGHHAPHILVIYDEASGIHSKIFEVGEGYMTTDGARALLIGNPTRTDGELFDAFHKKRSEYRLFHISAEDSPAVTGEWVPDDARAALTGKAWIEGRRKAWGQDSLLFQVRVLGNFAKGKADTVCALDVVEDAVDRDATLPHEAMVDDVTVACDVARFGSDETVIGTRYGNRVRIVRIHQGLPTTDTAGWIIKAWRDLRAEAGADPRIVIDDDGVGGGVTDQLHEKGYDVVPFRGGARAHLPARYPNRRSELWFSMARRLAELDLDDDEQLTADLVAPIYRLDSDGRRVVERKEETKKRLGRSPDRGDMALLTLVTPADISLPDRDRDPIPAPKGAADWEAAAPVGGSLTGDLLDADW